MQILNARYSAVVLALIWAPGSALATPFGLFDTRAMGMGGTGVSAGSAASAPHFNPALLSAAKRKSAAALEIKASVRAADPQKLQDDVDRVENAFTAVGDAIDTFNRASSGGNTTTLQNAAGLVATALGPFRDVFRTVSNKNIEVNAFAAPLTIAVPGKDLGWALFGAARADAGGRFVFDSSDDAMLGRYQTAARNYSNSGSAADLQALCGEAGGGGTTCDLEDPNFRSHLDVRGFVVQEIGLSLSREFHGRTMNWSMGITPKYQKVMTFDYSITPQNAEDADVETGRKDYSTFNFDLGIGKDLGSGFKAGLVGKNMISRTYDTAVPGKKIELKPQYRMGLSHHSSWTTLAVDVDLNKTKPIAFELESQFVALGLELDVWLLQLRAGYRHDLAGNYDGIPSVGLGLSLRFLVIDAAVARRGTEEAMGSVQLAFRF